MPGVVKRSPDGKSVFFKPHQGSPKKSAIRTDGKQHVPIGKGVSLSVLIKGGNAHGKCQIEAHRGDDLVWRETLAPGKALIVNQHGAV